MSSEQRRERLGLDHLSSEAFSAALAKLAADHQSAVEEHLRKRQAPPEPMSAFANIIDEEPTRRLQDRKPLPQPVAAKASSTETPASPTVGKQLDVKKQPVAGKQPEPAATKPIPSGQAKATKPRVAPPLGPAVAAPSAQEAVKQKEAALASLTALHLQLAGGTRSMGSTGKSGATTRPGSAGITSRSAGQRTAGVANPTDGKASETFASRMEQFGVMDEVSQLMSGLHKLPEPMRLLVIRGLQDAQSAVEVRDIIAQTQPLLA